MDPKNFQFPAGVPRANCKRTLDAQADRVAHFVRRIAARGLSPADWVVVLINVDAPFGGALADALMPGTDWQPIRDQGQVPFARGLADRAFITKAIYALRIPEVAEELRSLGSAVVVVDHGTIAAFEAQS